MIQRITTILLLALLPLWASAQATVPRPVCWPLVNGYPVSVPRHVAGQLGQHIYWPCSDAKGGPPTWNGLSCPTSVCSTRALGAALLAVTRASGKVGAANAEWDKAMQFDCAAVRAEATPRGALCRERQTILAQYAAEWLR